MLYAGMNSTPVMYTPNEMEMRRRALAAMQVPGQHIMRPGMQSGMSIAGAGQGMQGSGQPIGMQVASPPKGSMGSMVAGAPPTQLQPQTPPNFQKALLASPAPSPNLTRLRRFF